MKLTGKKYKDENIFRDLSRRSFVKLGLLSALAVAVPFFVINKLSFTSKLKKWNWQGSAMGMDISIQLCHESQKYAEDLVSLCVDEISRLESIFTLYSKDSELARLNKNGVLEHPTQELVELMSLASEYGDLTEGNFDMTLQPIWSVIKQEGIDSPNIKKVWDLVDYRQVEISPAKISFAKPGMAVSLNGIAQGYMTDKIASLLKVKGITGALLNIGEIRAIGGNEDNKPWKIGLHDPRKANYQDYFTEVLLFDKAISTSGGYGLSFNKDGTKHHIFNPKTGKSENYYLSLSVIADTATKADALSTAFYSMKIEEIKEVLAKFRNLSVIVMHHDGRVETL